MKVSCKHGYMEEDISSKQGYMGEEVSCKQGYMGEEVSCKQGYMWWRFPVSRVIWGGGFLQAGLYGGEGFL